MLKTPHNLLRVAGAIISCLLGLSALTARGAEVRGEQSGRWTASGSPYIVTGSIVIPDGATLTIEPGVIIKFAGYYSFKVNGTLRALGTSTNRIVLTSADDSEFDDSGVAITNPATANDWVGVEFTDSSNDEQCRFENVVIRYCTSPLVVTQAFPRKLESITIANCSSRFVNLNGERIPYQNGVEQDFIIKDAVYQAVAPADSSVEQTVTMPENFEPVSTAPADSSLEPTLTMPDSLKVIDAATVSDNGNEPTMSATPAGTATAMLQGVVADTGTDEVLPGANVEVVSVDGKMTRRTASGANGEFEFQNLAPGLYVVAVSYLGYAKKTVDDVALAAGEFKTLEIPLAPIGIEFNPITITASRRPKKVFEAPAAISVIGAGQMRPRSTLTAAEHLKAMPAVDFAGAGINQPLVALRGFNNVFASALLPLTDYRVARLPALRFNAFNLIPATNEDIERIEIVSGPSSALYGPNSANGVMHLITKSPFGSEGTTMSAGGGERLSFFGSIRHARSINNRLGYKISGQYYKGKDWENFDAQEPDSFVVAGGKVRAPERDFNVEKIGAEARVDFRVNEHLTSILTAGYSRVSDIELTGVGAMQAKNYGYGFLQGRVLYKNLFAQATVNRINAGNSFLLRTGAPVVDRSAEYAGQIQHRLALGNRQRFTYGLDIWQTIPVSGSTIYGRNEANDNINEIGAFLQSETVLSTRLNLVAALRVDDHNRLKDQVISPRAALLYDLSVDQNLRITYNRAFVTPTTNNLFLDLVTGARPPYVLRALGVPFKTGLTFRRGNNGRPLMMSPFLPNAGYIPATANAVWPALRQILIAGLPANLQPLLQTQLNATVLGDLRTLNPATSEFDRVADVKNVAPLEPTITNSVEVGYKALLKEKLFLAIDVYRARVEDFVGPLTVATPNVFANPQQFAAALQPTAVAITEALTGQGLTPAQAQAQAAAIVNSLVAATAKMPLGTISPKEIANASDLILTYRNFGDVALTGADFSFVYNANDDWKVDGNYSLVNKDFFPKSAGQPYDIALNAPKHKIGLGIQYGNLAQGWDGQLRLRYVEGFPVNSGVYIGEVQSYAVFDLNCSYDLSPKTRFFLTVQDVFDKHYREFVGAAVLGRLLIVRLSHSL
jgi:iron complex outermembrane receptor protein